MKTFSFIHEPYISAIELAQEMLPSLEKAVALYYCSEERKVVQLDWSEGTTRLSNVSTDLKIFIQKERRKKKPNAWTNPKDLIFEIDERVEAQYTIGDELENSVLALRFYNAVDDGYDLLYLFLNKSLSQFHLTKTEQQLTTANKAILEKTLAGSISFLLQQSRKNKSVLQNVVKASDQQKEEHNQARRELDRLKKNYGKSILNFSQHHLDKIATPFGVRFKLSDAATEKLVSYVGEFERLEEVLKEAASAAYNLNFNKKEIVIDSNHLTLYNYNSQNVAKADQSILEGKFSKTISYLDRYEEAAQRLLLKDLSVNGKNVANYCQPSVSAAAITINIRSHKEKILELLDRHPDKWSVLREHFRPIQNIMKDQALSKSA